MSTAAESRDRGGRLREARGVRGWTAEDFDPGTGIGEDPRALLETLFELEPGAWMRRMPGRETFVWPGREGLVVKRTSGGEARDWWYELLRDDAPRSPGRREAENLLALRSDGVRAPRALAWVEEREATKHPSLGGRGRRSAVVMENVPHARTLRDELAAASAGTVRVRLDELARVVATLHDAGWYHRDLYLQHFVVRDGDGALVLLDVGRARREEEPRARWFVKDLAALLHSAPPSIDRAARLRFLRDWLAGRGLVETTIRRRWARAVLGKARRLAAHAPRHVDPGGGR